MGKKHKKHKSDKHAHEEPGERPGEKPGERPGERPLKLVLKVSGSEVTTGGSSLDPVHDEPLADGDKPKEKKKKKKKDKEKSAGSPEDDKGKKKMTKKKKGPDVNDEDERSRTPIRSELDKQEEKEQTPLQEALNQLIRQLQRKDPTALFSFPVTDLIAPGYSMIIRRPMDFSTIKDKVKKSDYQSLDELKMDFRVMCENAMIYNQPETIYHKAARKLLNSGLKILNQERLDSLKQSIEFMSGLDPSAKPPAKTEDQGGPGGPSTAEGPQTPSRQEKDSKDEAAKVEKELQEIHKVIEESGGKLSNRVLQCDLEFSRRKADGSTTMTILNPADPSMGDAGFCPVKLGMMSNRLQSGVNSLQGFREDKRNRITPVTYVNYGPFTSFAPTYDSSFANISKEDSDLVSSLYGEEAEPLASDSLLKFLAKSDEYVYRLADDVLDAVTNGEHSRSLKAAEPVSAGPTTPSRGGNVPDKRLSCCSTSVQQVEEGENSQEDSSDMEVAEPDAADCSRLDFLCRAAGLQAAEQLSGEALHFQQKLDDTTRLLRELQEAQQERLSTKQPPNMICLLAPTARELELAEKVTGNLASLTGLVAPCDVSSVFSIRRAMGIAGPPEPLLDLTTVLEAEPMESSVGPVAV